MFETYNEDAEHDMWVDFDNFEDTGELSDLFEDSDNDTFIVNLND